MSSGLPRSRIVLGSRRSDLARIQAGRVAELLRGVWPGLDVATRWITTSGDRVLDRPLPEIGGKGVFTLELEALLMDGEIDAAVHSLKDLPTDLGEGLSVLGVPEREDPRDVLLTPDGPAGLGVLAEDARVGTSSLRRAAQLRSRRPDCRVRDLRGNVPTRIRKMEAGEYDAIVLAAAGLRRLELLASDARCLEPPAWLPAPGQGALGVEGRTGDEATATLLAAVEDPVVRVTVEAERSLLARLEGGCLVPIGALGSVDGTTLSLEAVVLSEDGSEEIRGSGSVTLAEEPGDRKRARRLGRSVAEEMLADGADQVLDRFEESGP